MLEYEWVLPKIDRDKIKLVKSILKVPDIIASILVSRGIDDQKKVMEYVRPNIFNLYSPFYFKDMEKAVKRIINSIENNKAILIFGDRDVDGVTATSILYRTLSKMKANVVCRVPEGDEGYSITKETIDWALLNEIDLIITVDCGITSVEEINYAKSLNLDIIITDHHEPRNILPEAYAIINPKVSSDNYPFNFLCGAGVAFKLALALIENFYLKDYHNEEIVVLDIETTGLIPGKDEIVEIGAVKVKNGIVIDKFQTLVKTTNPIPDEVIKIHHITNEMIQKDGLELKVALQKFIDFIGDNKLVGHNIIDFDLKFLNYYLKKELNFVIKNRIEDTLKMSRIMIKKVKDHSLNTIAQYFGIYEDQTKLHRSLMDCKICAEIYRRLILSRNSKYLETFSELLPLVAVGTVADIMPLVDENRNIVKNGIKMIPYTSIGFVTLLRSINLNIEKITPRDISYIIAPLLNAPGRVGDASLSVELLISSRIKEAEELVETIISKNQIRKNITESGMENAINLIDKEIASSNKIIFISSDKISKGTTGLIANKISSEMLLPSVVISVDKDYSVGSIRCSGSFNAITLLENMADLFTQYGGHKYACGFTIKTENIDKLKERVLKYMENVSLSELKEYIQIDAILESFSDLDINTLRYLENILDPIGYGNEIPKLLVKNVKIIDYKKIGKNLEHCQLYLQKSDKFINAIYWNGANIIEKLKNNSNEDARFELVATPEINSYQSIEECRLNIISIKPQETM